MATIVNDSYMVCGDCFPVVANGDYSHLDYYYTEEEAKERKKEIDQGISTAVKGNHWISSGMTELDREFSRSPCDCCGDVLAGSRHHCILFRAER